MEEHLRKLISEHYLDEFADKIVTQAKPVIGLVKEKTRGRRTGGSQLGGVPDVAPGFAWPMQNGNPLGFIAQINCSELKVADTDRVFPNAGLLYFFCDIEEWPGGFDPKDKERFRVIHLPETDNMAPAVPPDNLRKAQTLPAIPIGFQRFLSIPDLNSAAGKTMGIGSNWYNEYYSLLYATHGVRVNDTDKHQLLGWPVTIQDDMALQCQLASNGIFAGDGEA